MLKPKFSAVALLLMMGLSFSGSLRANESHKNINSMLTLANKGFTQAQHFVGETYYTGRGGVTKDKALALYWFERAAAQGQPHSQYFAGLIHYQDKQPSSQEKALSYFEQSARSGFAHAQFHLGQMIYQGEHVQPDYDAAIGWYMLAAEQGLAKAQHNVGLMYYKGLGTDENKGAALYWLTKGCENHFPKSCEAVHDLAQRMEYGDPLYLQNSK